MKPRYAGPKNEASTFRFLEASESLNSGRSSTFVPGKPFGLSEAFMVAPEV
jgi:hypothetical protein